MKLPSEFSDIEQVNSRCYIRLFIFTGALLALYVTPKENTFAAAPLATSTGDQASPIATEPAEIDYWEFSMPGGWYGYGAFIYGGICASRWVNEVRGAKPGSSCAQAYAGLFSHAGPVFKYGAEHAFALANTACEAPINYLRDLRALGWRRFFIRSRPQDLSLFERYTTGLISNPFASIFNRPRQLTLPFTAMGYLAFFEIPMLVWENKIEEARSRIYTYRANKQEVPGLNYVMGLRGDGFLSEKEANDAVEDHENALLMWVESKDPRARMPRVNEFIRHKFITKQESVVLDAIMRQAFAEAASQALAYKNERNVAAEKSGHPPLPATPNQTFSFLLNANFRRLLNAPESPFAQKTGAIKTILFSAFFPPIAHEGVSDIELHRRMYLDPEVPQLVVNVRQMMMDKDPKTNVSIGTGFLMAKAAYDNPKADHKLRTEIRQVLRNHQAELLISPGSEARIQELIDKIRRPQLGMFSHPREFSGRALRNEADRWNLLFTDDRFQHIRKALLDGKVNDVQALKTLEIETSAWKEILTMDKLAEGKRFGPSEAALLLGMAPNSRANAFLYPTRDDMLQLLENRNANESEAMSCFINIVEYWRKVIVEKDSWLKQNPRGDFARHLDATHIQIEQDHEKLRAQCAGDDK